jgi:hypothetical protein
VSIYAPAAAQAVQQARLHFLLSSACECSTYIVLAACPKVLVTLGVHDQHCMFSKCQAL